VARSRRAHDFLQLPPFLFEIDTKFCSNPLGTHGFKIQPILLNIADIQQGSNFIKRSFFIEFG
jgi:hypothetical protein